VSDDTEKAKIAKLPKWVRQHIQKLEADLAFAKKEILLVRTPGASRVRLVRLEGSQMAEVPLPEDAVAFYPDPAKDESVTVSVQGDHVEIRATGRGGTVLAVLPQGSNVVWARTEPA